MIRTPRNGILFPRNLLKMIPSVEINSVENFPDLCINKTPSDYDKFNLIGLRFNLKIDNSAMQRGFENELTSNGNNQ